MQQHRRLAVPGFQDAHEGVRPRGRSVGASAALVLSLQRAAGNAAVRRLLAQPRRPSPGPDLVIQRDIKAGEKSGTAGFWANQYADAQRGTFGEARSALIIIEQSGEEFDGTEALFAKVADVVEARKQRAKIPLTSEKSATRVAVELDYYFADLEQSAHVTPLPVLTLAETYESNWDHKGGFGAEYHPNIQQEWVVHVHRGPNGGLKAARVKTWATRTQQQQGMSITKLDNLVKLGVPMVDTTRKTV